MIGSISNGLLFLIDAIFNLYLCVLIIRLILACAHAPYNDPFTQFIIKLTGFLVKPLKRIIPDVKGIELSTIFLILVIAFIKRLLIALIPFQFPNLLGVLVLAFSDFIYLTLQIFFYAILIQAILSWFQPGSPLNQVLYQVTYPILRPFQRIIPRIQGIDISPIPALILIQLLIIVFVFPLIHLGSVMIQGT